MRTLTTGIPRRRVVIELFDLRAFVPSRERGSATGTPLHRTERGQGRDKSREVRPGRMAEKHGDISILARCAFRHCNVLFPQTPAKSKAATHRVEPSQESAPQRAHRPFDRLALAVIS